MNGRRDFITKLDDVFLCHQHQMGSFIMVVRISNHILRTIDTWHMIYPDCCYLTIFFAEVEFEFAD